MARAPQQETSGKSGMKGGSRRDDDRDDDRRSRRDDDDAKSAKSRRDEDEDNGSDNNERDERDSRDDDRRSSKSSNGSGKSEKSAAKGRSRDDDDRRSGGEDDDDAPINLEEAEEGGAREVMPRGKYLCRVDDAEFTTFKTGSKGAKIKLEVIEGDYAAGEDGPMGKRKKGLILYTNIVISAAAAGIVKTSLKALGVDKKVYNNPSFRPSHLQRLCDEGDLVGNEVIADVKVGQYNGDKNNQVSRLILPGSDDKADGKGGFLEE